MVDYMPTVCARWQAALLALVAILALPAGAEAATNTTSTSSFSSSTTFNESSRTDRVDTFLTRITARLDGGATIYDQSFNVAFSDPLVTAAIAAAQAALNGAIDPDPVIVGPTLISSIADLVTSSMATIETPAGFTQTITVEETIGPGSTLIGNRDLGGELFIVPGGNNNFNVNTHTEFFVDRLFLTTETYLTTEEYELVGFPQQVAGVPAPASLGMLGLGLAGLALARRRRSVAA